MQLAIVGSSHINALKAAFDDDASLRDLSENPFFFALNAPILSKQNHLGWPGAPGSMSCDIPEGQNFLSRVFGDATLCFEPDKYEVILLADFFFAYDFSVIFRDVDTDRLSVGGTPVSGPLFTEILKGRMGHSNYNANSAVGEVPDNSTLPLLHRIRQAAPDATIALTPRPMMPGANREQRAIRLDAQGVRRGADVFDAAATSLLEPIGITYLARTEAQICPQTGLTSDHFSTGMLDTTPPRLDEHMNGQYGRIVLDQLQELLDRQNQ